MDTKLPNTTTTTTTEQMPSPSLPSHSREEGLATKCEPTIEASSASSDTDKQIIIFPKVPPKQPNEDITLQDVLDCLREFRNATQRDLQSLRESIEKLRQTLRSSNQASLQRLHNM